MASGSKVLLEVDGPIPAFRPDGYLPAGLHLATEEEVATRLGAASVRRRALMERVTEWVVLARTVRARRFLLDGSFVTAKDAPEDVDAVCWLPDDFEEQYLSGAMAAVRLYRMLVTRQPAELFGVFGQQRWDEWVAFFSETRELDGREKGLVEVIL
jgi:hypothetical protein